MKPHPVSAPGGGLWAHLADLPEDLRKVLLAELEQGEQEDQALITAALVAMRQTQLSMRAPKMCKALESKCPGLSKRKVFVAVSLVTGISEMHVRRLYYGDRRKG